MVKQLCNWTAEDLLQQKETIDVIGFWLMVVKIDTRQYKCNVAEDIFFEFNTQKNAPNLHYTVLHQICK